MPANNAQQFMGEGLNTGTGSEQTTPAPDGSGRPTDGPDKDGVHTCEHCGTAFFSRDPAEAFCCRGCAYVYNLIRERGWGRYYALKDRPIQPVKSTPFHPRDTAWAEAWQRAAEGAGPDQGWAVGTLSIQGISCVGCVWLIERLFREQDGAGSIEIDAQRGRARVTWKPGNFDAAACVRQLQKFGYLAGLPGVDVSSEARRVAGRLGLCGAFALNTMLFTLPRYLGMEPDFALARLFELLALLFATLSLGVGGSYFATRALRALRKGVLHMDFPIALGLAAAWAGSMAGWLGGRFDLLYFDFVAIFTFLMLLGRYAQEFAIERNRSNLLQEDWESRGIVRVGTDGGCANILWSKLRAGDVLEIAAGALLPVCARMEDPKAEFSLEWINGESDPRAVASGQMVPAGALNISRRSCRATAVEDWEHSLLAKLIDRRSFNPRNPLLERVLKYYIGTVLAVALAGAGAWWVFGGQGWTALQVFISVLVVSCPCALGVAIPRASEMAVSRLRKDGVFVREETLWQRFGKARKLVFDKTGTLTLENPELRNPATLNTLDAEARRALTHLVAASFHPVGRSLREALAHLPQGTSAAAASPAIHEETGNGVWTCDAKGTWSLGKPAWNPPSSPAGITSAVTVSEDACECELRLNGQVLAQFEFAEEVRPNAAHILEFFRKRGYEIFILSGDRRHKVESMAAQLGLPPAAALAELSPRQKADWVRRENAAGGVLMIGDGANDSLAFDEATCRGTPVVDKGLLEHKADFYFLGRDLHGLKRLHDIRALRSRAINQVFLFALIYNFAAVGLCLAALMNPLLAAVIMPLSSLATLAIVIHNLK